MKVMGPLKHRMAMRQGEIYLLTTNPLTPNWGWSGQEIPAELWNGLSLVGWNPNPWDGSQFLAVES